MMGLLHKFRRREDGIASVELALVTPVFLLLFLSVIEVGHMIYYSITVEKALRSAATYVGRHEELTADVISQTEWVAKTGRPNGTAADYVVGGWAKANSSVEIATAHYTATMTGQSEDVNETVYTVTVKVPYVPVIDVLIPALNYLLEKGVYDGEYIIELHHDQAMIGN